MEREFCNRTIAIKGCVQCRRLVATRPATTSQGRRKRIEILARRAKNVPLEGLYRAPFQP